MLSRQMKRVAQRLGLSVVLILIALPLEACGKESPANTRFILRMEETLSVQPAVYFHFDTLATGDLYPSIVITGKEIQFRSAGGQVRKSVRVPPSTSIVPTASGKFVGLLRLEGSLERPTSVATQVFQVYDQNGTRLYEIRQPVRYDDPFGQFYLSNLDGRCVVADPGRGVVQFYDRKGKLLRKVDLFADDSYDLERTLVAAFSEDGRRVALATMKRAPAPPVDGRPAMRGEPHLFIFAPDGTELHRLPLPGDVVQELAIAPDASSAAVATYGMDLSDSRTTLFDAQGRKIGSVDLLFRHAAYSADGTKLLLAENHRMVLLSSRTAKVQWDWSMESMEGTVVAIGLSPSATMAAALLARTEFQAGEFLMSGAQLTLLDGAGKLLTTRLFPLEMFRRAYLALSEKEVALGIDSGYKIYRKE